MSLSRAATTELTGPYRSAIAHAGHMLEKRVGWPAKTGKKHQETLYQVIRILATAIASTPGLASSVLVNWRRWCGIVLLVLD